MNWIKVTDDLPNAYEKVLIWIKYEGETEFECGESEIDENNPLYIEPNSGQGWKMGSAINYEITHWATIEAPD